MAEQVVLVLQRNTMFTFGKHFFSLMFLINIWAAVQIRALEAFLQLRIVADT